MYHLSAVSASIAVLRNIPFSNHLKFHLVWVFLKLTCFHQAYFLFPILRLMETQRLNRIWTVASHCGFCFSVCSSAGIQKKKKPGTLSIAACTLGSRWRFFKVPIVCRAAGTLLHRDKAELWYFTVDLWPCWCHRDPPLPSSYPPSPRKKRTSFFQDPTTVAY